MAAIPVFKLAMLAVKSLSKPIAKQMKDSAKTHPLLKRVCYHTGNTWHVASVKVNISFLGHKIKEIKQLPEEQAVSQGAEIVSEFFVYSVAAATIIVEVVRNNKKSASDALKKKQRQDEKHRVLTQQLESVTDNIERIQKEIMAEIAVLREENVSLKQQVESLKSGGGILSWLSG